MTARNAGLGVVVVGGGLVEDSVSDTSMSDPTGVSSTGGAVPRRIDFGGGAGAALGDADAADDRSESALAILARSA